MAAREGCGRTRPRRLGVAVPLDCEPLAYVRV